MKVILSTSPYSVLKNRLMLCKNQDEVYRCLMKENYLCFLTVLNKKKLDDVLIELVIFFSHFHKNLYVTALHNGRFYEEEGISKLDHWSYFRNIKENDNGDLPGVTTEQTSGQKERVVIEKIQKHNFQTEDIFRCKITYKEKE